MKRYYGLVTVLYMALILGAFWWLTSSSTIQQALFIAVAGSYTLLSVSIVAIDEQQVRVYGFMRLFKKRNKIALTNISRVVVNDSSKPRGMFTVVDLHDDASAMTINLPFAFHRFEMKKLVARLDELNVHTEVHG